MLIDNRGLPMAKPRGTIKRFGTMGNAATAKKIMVRDALSLRANFGCESASPRRDAPESLQKPFALKEPDRK
jgi:hypothetical protein